MQDECWASLIGWVYGTRNDRSGKCRSDAVSASRAMLGLIGAGRSPPFAVTTVHSSRNRSKLTRPYRTLALTLIAPYVCRAPSKGRMSNSWSSLAATP